MNVPAISYVISLEPEHVKGLVLLLTAILLSWSWGNILNFAFGLNKWYGLLLLVPGVNLVSFVIFGATAQKRILEREFDQIKVRVDRLFADYGQKYNRDRTMPP